MNTETLELFRTLTELQAAPGFEREIRKFVRGELEKYTDEFVQDGLGSLFGILRGDEAGPKIMVAGHFDEVAYGGRPATQADVSTARSGWPAVVETARTTSGTP